MPYDVLEAQIKSLPEVYYNELVDYLEFLIQKADKEKNNVIEENDKNEQKLDFKILSRREIEVARLAAKGYTNSQIAEELFISTETVKSHMNSIFEKLKITSRKELL